MKPVDRRYYSVEDRSRRVTARILAVFTIITGLGYLLWVFHALNANHNLMSWSFFLAEIACLGLFCLASFDVWRVRFKPLQSLQGAEETLSADVFITAYAEPLSIVGKTLVAAAEIRWKGPLNVYVLDDGKSRDLRRYVEKLGFHYLSRPASGMSLDNAKSGNLNFGLSHSSGDLVLVLDADQIPRPEIVEVLSSYMRFPEVAFVQSQQYYLTQKDDPFFNRDPVFYGAVQLGLDDSNSVISCGSGVLYRRTALDDIGGFATWNIVEDLTTSYELHSRGWKSLYYPYPLTAGLAPTDIKGVYQQRGQWALDAMRIFFHDNPLLKRGLNWRKRINYITIPLAYLCSGFIFPFFYIVPLWSYLTGNSILTRPELEFFVIRLFYFIAMACALRFLLLKKQAGKQFQMLVGLFPIYILNTARAVFYPRGRKPKYCTNVSDTCQEKRDYPQLLFVLPQLVIFGANALLPFLAVLLDTAAPRLVAANCFISAVAIWSLWQVLAATFGKQAWSSEEDPSRIYALDSQTIS